MPKKSKSDNKHSKASYHADIVASKALFGHFVQVPFEMPMIPLPVEKESRVYTRTVTTKDGSKKRIHVESPPTACTLGLDAAYLFSYLHGHHRCVSRDAEKDDGWFYCPTKKIEADLGFKENKQSILLQKLKSMDYVSTKMTHTLSASHRWFYLNVEKVWNDIVKMRQAKIL